MQYSVTGWAGSIGVFLARHPARAIRIIDMVARRGRTLVLIAAGFGYVVRADPEVARPREPRLRPAGQRLRLDRDELAGLLAFHSNGAFGNIMYGAQARVLDGVQGRANALLIGTLWSAFRFVMIPIGLVLAAMYPPNRYAVLFAFIWIMYAASDYATEIFGSIWGRHTIRVWGIGDMNKKSWEGFAAGSSARCSSCWRLPGHSSCHQAGTCSRWCWRWSTRSSS